MNHQVPLVGRGPSREDIKRAEIVAAMNTLSLEIYSRLAASHLESLGVDRDRFKAMAKSSQIAAEAYFEGLGIITLNK